MAEIVYITASTRENTRHTHVAKCERSIDQQSGMLIHKPSSFTLCGQLVLDRTIYSDAWKQYTKRSASSCCAMCMDILADERLDKARAEHA